MPNHPPKTLSHEKICKLKEGYYNAMHTIDNPNAYVKGEHYDAYLADLTKDEIRECIKILESEDE